MRNHKKASHPMPFRLGIVLVSPRELEFAEVRLNQLEREINALVGVELERLARHLDVVDDDDAAGVVGGDDLQFLEQGPVITPVGVEVVEAGMVHIFG